MARWNNDMTAFFNHFCWEVTVILVFVLYNLRKPIHIRFTGETINQILSPFHFSYAPYGFISPLHHQDASFAMPATKNKAACTCVNNHIVIEQV